MKILCYIPLHYGKEYLFEAIKSINSHVDQILILYTEKPSFGHSTDLICPDSEKELHKIASSASDKLVWKKIKIGNEGDHRNLAIDYAIKHGFDLLLAVDADEIWDEDALSRCLNLAFHSTERYFQIKGFINFYRSFNTICLDGFEPIRITNINNSNKLYKMLEGRIYHFSYAQSVDIIKYKWTCHGHQNELRPNWLNEKFINFIPGMQDLHPVVIGLWNPIPFDRGTLPLILKSHSNFNKDIIT